MGIVNNQIIMNRGDSYMFDLTIDDPNAEDGRYRLQDDDVVYFGIMDPGQPFELALVRKRYTATDTDAEGNLTINIYPADTLDLLPGKYFYAVKIHLDHEERDLNTGELTGRRIDRVATVVSKTKFILCD